MHQNNPEGTCRNCGQTGHLYKECKFPIISFGLICFRVVNGQLEYIMVQRKDSLSFMEFVRGKYDLTNITYIRALLSKMTHSERNMLTHVSFEDIWKKSWSQPNANLQSEEYIKARDKFDALCKGYMVDKHWVDLRVLVASSFTIYDEPEWGFPKGRRRLREQDLSCAIREFCEETNLKRDSIHVFNLPPFEEVFYGTNNVLYRHVYYLASIIKDAPAYVDPTNYHQIREIRNVAWYPYEKAMQQIRIYNKERRALFEQANLVVKSCYMSNESFLENRNNVSTSFHAPDNKIFLGRTVIIVP